MVHPILFKDKCSCGGKLSRVNRYGKEARSDDDVVGLKCDSCKDTYFIQWDVATGEPKPLFSKEDTISSFLNMYKECGDK